MSEDGELVLRGPPSAVGSQPGAVPKDRIRLLVDEHYDVVWRRLRRLGVSPGEVDDATQDVFVVLQRKLRSVRAGCESRFLFQTALRVASHYRRTRRRRREAPEELEAIDRPDGSEDAFELLALRRAREKLDRVLDAMPLDLRAVFVLFEFEQLTMADIAETTGLRPGTVASRLRRARAIFSERLLDLAEKT